MCVCYHILLYSSVGTRSIGHDVMLCLILSHTALNTLGRDRGGGGGE